MMARKACRGDLHDVRHGYVSADATRDLYVRLPEEDLCAQPGGVGGELDLCFCWTQDAATELRETIRVQLEHHGFTRGVGHPCVHCHPYKLLNVLVHGDDYVSWPAGIP